MFTGAILAQRVIVNGVNSNRITGSNGRRNEDGTESKSSLHRGGALRCALSWRNRRHDMESDPEPRQTQDNMDISNNQKNEKHYRE